MAYRDDEHALEIKKAEIEARLAQIEAQQRELEGLSREGADLGKELVDVTRRLDEKRRLPLLSRVEVAAPCSADWASMVGDDRARFCTSCEKNVYNLSAMTAQEAEQLIRSKEGNLCVRYFQRKDGTVMTSDCPVGVRRRRVRRVLSVVAVGVGAVGAAWAGLGMRVERAMGQMQLAPERHTARVTMGELTPEQFLVHDDTAGKTPKQPAEKP
ncbi:hypothetical protein [Polyangium sorediatum]|uniref:Uncharacterized protein n=1 Tax=Polyangium sorediatum TaxID=889274 RepID=A0ABT6NR99_9BACT|nr:hypothetical protein [Polyangium sorediatum]MDI1430700.1 hypothetical protein [Polyangium sorediatum]